MTTQTVALDDCRAYQIARLSTGMDGGVAAESYYLVPTVPLRSYPVGPPVLPRPEQVEGVRALQGCAAAILVIAIAICAGIVIASWMPS